MAKEEKCVLEEMGHTNSKLAAFNIKQKLEKMSDIWTDADKIQYNCTNPQSLHYGAGRSKDDPFCPMGIPKNAGGDKSTCADCMYLKDGKKDFLDTKNLKDVDTVEPFKFKEIINPPPSVKIKDVGIPATKLNYKFEDASPWLKNKLEELEKCKSDWEIENEKRKEKDKKRMMKIRKMIESATDTSDLYEIQELVKGMYGDGVDDLKLKITQKTIALKKKRSKLRMYEEKEK